MRYRHQKVSLAFNFQSKYFNKLTNPPQEFCFTIDFNHLGQSLCVIVKVHRPTIVTMEPQPHMQWLVKRALAGDKEALDIFDIGKQEIVPKIKAVSFHGLCADLRQASIVTLAARQLNLCTMEQISHKLVLSISSLIKARFPERTMGTNITNINEDEILEEMDVLLAEKPTEKHNKDVSDSESDDSKMATTDSDLETQETHSAGEERKRAANKSPSKGKRPAIRSHHKKKACSVAGCNFFGSDLKRHLKIHASKGEIAEENIAKLATNIKSGKKQGGKSVGISKSGKSKRGRMKKWCPVPGCSSIILNEEGQPKVQDLP